MRKMKLVLLASVAVLSACATNFANLSPIDIASNSVRRTDAVSGVSEIIAPRFKVLTGRRSFLRGQAQLRTAGPFTDHEGHVHTGGAYLDVTLKYKSATPHPEEARMYDQASWPGGETALVAEYGASVLDCREEVREYRDYTPIYGAWGYGHIHDDYCGHSHGGYGYYGYGHVHDDDCGHTVDHGDDGNSPIVIRPTTGPRPDPRPVSGAVYRDNNTRVPRPNARRPHMDGVGTEPDAHRQPRGRRISSQPSPSAARAEPRSEPRPAASSPATSRPTSVRSESRPATHSSSSSSSTSSTRTRSSSRSSTRRPARATSARNRVQRHMNYYPRQRYNNYGTTNYSVRRSCDRQENIRVFIPRERINSADVNGMVLYLRSRGGQEEVLTLPPNYISGFKLAAWSPEGERLTMPGSPRKPVQAAEVSAPAQGNVDPQKPIIYGEN